MICSKHPLLNYSLKTAICFLIILFSFILIPISGKTQIITQPYNPVMVKEILPGPSHGCYPSSDPLQAYKNGVFFSGNDSIHGDEPWFSDGTNAGTVMLMDINPGTASSYPHFMGIVNNKLLFAASNPLYGYELWATDGTSAGTSLLFQVAPGANSGEGVNTELDTMNNVLYFWGTTTATGKELYRSDGTAAGTYFLGDLNPGVEGAGDVQSSYFWYQKSGGKLFCNANGYLPCGGLELMATDGTISGTHLIDINNTFNNSCGSNPYVITEINGEVFIEAFTDINGYELWKSDGTASGTVLYHEFTPGTSPISPLCTEIIPEMSMGSIRGIFRRAVIGNNYEFYRLDGTPSGITLLKTFRFQGSQLEAIKFNNMIYFDPIDSAIAFGRELWKTDLTAAGTVMVKDIYPGAGSSGPVFRGIVNNIILIEADHPTYGRELWRSNGTSLNTTLVKDIKPNVSPYLMVDDGIMYGTNKYIFTVDYNNLDPWITDGTTNGTFALKNTTHVFDAYNYYNTEGKVFFIGNQSNTSDEEVYVTDGTVSGTKLVKDVNVPAPNMDHITEGFVRSGNTLFYNFKTVASGSELWKIQFSIPPRNPTHHIRIGNNETEASMTNLNVYPNPSTDLFTIELGETGKDEMLVEVSDISGKIILKKLMMSNPFNDTVELNLSGYESGMYFVQLTAPGYSKNCRLVKE